MVEKKNCLEEKMRINTDLDQTGALAAFCLQQKAVYPPFEMTCALQTEEFKAF